MNKITGYFVDPENCIAEPRTIEHSLEGFYTLLRCDCIDIPSRMIGDRRFDIICDDEGLLKDDTFFSAYGCDGSPMLIGPIFVVKFDGKEDVTSLTQDELDYIEDYVETGWAVLDGKVRVGRVLVGLDY